MKHKYKKKVCFLKVKMLNLPFKSRKSSEGEFEDALCAPGRRLTLHLFFLVSPGGKSGRPECCGVLISVCCSVFEGAVQLFHTMQVHIRDYTRIYCSYVADHLCHYNGLVNGDGYAEHEVH